VPSASRHSSRLLVAACAGALLLGTGAGCTTTQEKAAKHQAEAERILEARAERQKKKQKRNEGGEQAKPRENGGRQ
jgi:hypothetical protein